MTEGDASETTAGEDTRAWSREIATMLDEHHTAVIVLGLDGGVRAANRTALQMLGAATPTSVRRGEASHELLLSLLDHAPRHLSDGSSAGTWHGDIDLTTASGQRLVCRTTVMVHRGATGNGDGFIGITAHDVTFAREEVARLRHLAGHDPLTGLANRGQILAVLAGEISRQRDRPGHLAAMFVDLDRLGYVNDSLGHQIGDRVLVAAARRLSDTVRPQDHVARVGGDEFFVLCPDIADADAALDVAARLRQALSGKLRLRHLELDLSASIGVALSGGERADSTDAARAAALLGDADTAMQAAKAAGRSRSVLFTPAMRTAARERATLGAELSRAIDSKRLSVAYQPVFSAVTRRIVGAEALVRWDDFAHGVVEPRALVEIAERSGTIGKLGEFVLDQAMAQTRRWLDQGTVDAQFAMHVNISELELAGSSFVHLVGGLLRQHGLRPDHLVVEAQAAVLGRNADVDRSIAALRRVGVKIAIDHFGTGPDALSVPAGLGVDILKLDGAFGLVAGATSTDTRVVRAVVALAHALDVRIVAERVSNLDQLQRLRASGCDHIQGNLLAAASGPERLVVVAPY